jgi:hypothetical protein
MVLPAAIVVVVAAPSIKPAVINAKIVFFIPILPNTALTLPDALLLTWILLVSKFVDLTSDFSFAAWQGFSQ